MNKKLNLLVMLVGLLALSLVFGSCDNGTTDPGGGDNGITDLGSGDTGTFRIKITDIPSKEMTAFKDDGDILIGLFKAYTTAYTTDNALAGRSTWEDADDDKFGPDWYEFFIYDVIGLGSNHYVGTAGNYDIGFINTETDFGRVLKNERLEVSETNTLSYDDFVNVNQ
jgi:hypothetical protein